MAIDVIMPKLGLTMEEGMIVSWLVAPGEFVIKGQPLLEVETDKVIVEVEAPASGILGPPMVAEGEIAPLGKLLARIYEKDEEIIQTPNTETASPAASAPTKEPPPTESKPAEIRPVRPPAPDDSPGQRLFSSPRARLRARELGIDWRTVPGSGPHGRVVERDVLASAHARASLLRPQSPRQPAALAPAAFTLSVRVNLTALQEANARIAPWLEQQPGLQLTRADWLVRFLVALLPEFPQLLGDEQGDGVAIGVLVWRETGPTTALTPGAQNNSLRGIAQARLQSTETNPTLAPVLVVDMHESRITDLSLNELPAAVVLSLGGDEDDGKATLTLSVRQPRTDWQTGVRFLQRLGDLLEEPLGLFEIG